MTTSTIEKDVAWPRATRATVNENALTVDLDDGRTISVPLGWYPRLAQGTPQEWAKYEIGPFGIHWPELDEDISVRGLLLGHMSGESPKSFQRWLEHRAKGEKPWLKPEYRMGD